MTRRLRYFTVGFYGDDTVKLYSFDCATDAEQGARILAVRGTGALAFQQLCDEELGDYDAPDLLLALGRIPDTALAQDHALMQAA